jgi:hypothetical protein
MGKNRKTTENEKSPMESAIFNIKTEKECIHLNPLRALPS